MHHHLAGHDPVLVALSVLVAALGSYTALDLATRMRAASGRSRLGWLAAAATACGGGTWAMHFVGMLAFSMPGMEVSYDPALTVVSLAIPIATAAGAFFVVGRRPGALLFAGLALGLGIVAMHYTGMAAMRMAARVTYAPAWVAVSVFVAVGASTAALWLAFRNTSLTQRALAGLVMGLAISGMHYAAMAGATFAPDDFVLHRLPGAGVGHDPLAFLIAGAAIVILFMGIAASGLDRVAAEIAGREAAALRRSEERYRLLVEGLADHAIFMLDPDGRVANWNRGAERLFGHAGDIVGSHFCGLYDEEARAAGVPAEALAQAARDGKSESEGWRVRRDGSRFWAESVVVAARGGPAGAAGFVKIVRDVSERRRAKEALERTRDALVMAQKMDTIGQLTGGVAHDFNNLLAAVLGSLELLRKRLPQDDAKAQRLLDTAMKGAQRGASLTQRMLAFARRQELKPVAVDVAELVHGMAGLLKFGPGIRVETRFPVGLAKALVDANQLELSVLNLAVNARDAMPKGGEIVIAAREENGAGELTAGRYIVLSVADGGCGMDEATLRRAGEPFFTTKGVGKGTGLGLPMVHGLAQQSGGRLTLKSRPGEGTVAELWLPVAAAEAEGESREAETAAPRPRRPLAVLVVDDDLLVLDNVAAMIEDLGHRVATAKSGEEALEALRRTPGFDLVLTDYAMPGMTGLELAERIAAARPGMPVLLTTGYAEMPEGPARHLPKLSKPFDQARLDEAIGAAVGDPSGELAFSEGA